MNIVNVLQGNLDKISDKIPGLDKLSDSDRKGFLNALVQSGALKDGKLTEKELQTVLQQQFGKELPDAGEILQLLLGVKAGADKVGAGKPGSNQVAEADVVAVEAKPAHKDDGKKLDPTELLQLIAMGDGALINDPDKEALLGKAQDALTGAGKTVLMSQLKAFVESGTAQLQGNDRKPDAGAQQNFQMLSAAIVNGDASATSQAQRTDVANLQLATPMDHPDWGQGLGERLTWLAKNDVQQASLHIHPKELGPIQISISTKGDHASVAFMVHHGATHDAVQNEIPRLRHMLAEQGFGAVDVNVARDQSQPGGHSHQSSGNAGAPGGHGGGVEGEAEEMSISSVGMVKARGLVDHYA